MTEPQRKKGFFSRIFGSGDAEEKSRPEASPEASTESTTAEAAARQVAAEAAPEEPVRDELASVELAVPPVEETMALEQEAAPSVAPVPIAPAAAVEAPDLAAPVAPPAGEPSAKEAKPSWFARLKSGLTKTSAQLSSGITGLFTKRKLDAETLDDFEDLLIQADLGVDTAMRVTRTLSSGRFEKGISPDQIRRILADEVERVLKPVAKPLVIDRANRPHVVLMVGVNGTGKTTTIGKLAQRYSRDGLKVMIAAGDTFRAAAIDQLKVWGERSRTHVVSRDVGADSAGLAFDALKEAQADQYDVLLIDTAGRLQNKAALMDELEKVVRVLRKLEPSAPHDVLLVLDATTGQNALQQVEVFRQRAGVTGLVMTKLDGTARGGIVVAIADKYGLPVHAIGVGEGIEDLQPFEAGAFARAIADI